MSLTRRTFLWSSLLPFPALAADALAVLEARAGGRLGVTLLDTGSGRRWAHRGEERFALCSTFKLPLAGAVLYAIDQGHLRADVRLPLRRDEKALRQMLQHALPLTVLQYRRDRLLVQRVRQLLAAPLPGQPAHALPQHSAETLAALLHVSPRTLHRQLKEEGATLQGLKDEVRRTRAVELLHRTQRPIKQVAEAAGFENEKSFIRAFRGWTGQSPAEFRKAVRV